MTTTLREHYTDSPITVEMEKQNSGHDLLKLGSFAEALAEFMVDCETPMTIGLQGDWGTGKTSLMHMIDARLPEQIQRVDLNTWHYSMFGQDAYLGIAVVKALVEKIAEKIDPSPEKGDSALHQVSGTLGKFLRKASALAQTVEIGVPFVGGVTIKDAKEALSEGSHSIEYEDLSAVLRRFRDQFEALVDDYCKTHPGSKVVVFVDDLDRVRPGRALEVLEALKNFMLVKGCIFVLAVDYEIVQLGIREKFGADIQKSTGKSFFDKIIQLPFQMPTCSYDIENYLLSLLGGCGFLRGEACSDRDDREFFVNVTEVTVGRNPRSIKRVVNYASLLEKIRSQNASRESTKSTDRMKLLYAIVCMQIAWPELFEYLLLNPSARTIANLENWEYLERLPQARRLMERASDRDAVRGNVAAYFDELYTLLDVSNRDGVISEEELTPLRNMLKLVKLTSDRTIERAGNPLDIFELKVRENAREAPELVRFFQSVYKNSSWGQSSDVEYRAVGQRYVLTTIKRRQCGSLVTLRSRPLTIRLCVKPGLLVADLPEGEEKSFWLKALVPLEHAASVTGFGDIELRVDELLALPERRALAYLERLYEFMSRHGGE